MLILAVTDDYLIILSFTLVSNVILVRSSSSTIRRWYNLRDGVELKNISIYLLLIHLLQVCKNVREHNRNEGRDKLPDFDSEVDDDDLVACLLHKITYS